MQKLKFLHSTYLLSHKKVFNHKDEVEIESPDLVKHLVENGLAEQVSEGKKAKKTAKKEPKTTEEQVDKDA